MPDSPFSIFRSSPFLSRFVPSSLRRSTSSPQPDLLAELFPPSQLLQLDQVHLRCMADVVAGRLRLLALAQNTRDTAGRLNLRLAVTAGREALAGRLPPLRIEIGPAAILMARLDIPLRATPRPLELRLLIKGSAVIRGGRAVRPQRRMPVHRRVRPPFVPQWTLWPRRPSLRQWFLRRRPMLCIALAPLAPADALNPLHHPIAWQVGEFWIPGEPVAIDELKRQVNAAMGLDGASPHPTPPPIPAPPDGSAASVHDKTA
jgi:hypothetical protein